MSTVDFASACGCVVFYTLYHKFTVEASFIAKTGQGRELGAFFACKTLLTGFACGLCRVKNVRIYVSPRALLQSPNKQANTFCGFVARRVCTFDLRATRQVLSNALSIQKDRRMRIGHVADARDCRSRMFSAREENTRDKQGFC